MSDKSETEIFGFCPKTIGNRYRGHWIVTADDGSEPDGVLPGFLCVEARDGGSNPIDADACKHANFFTTVENDFDRTYRYYYYKPLEPAAPPAPSAPDAIAKAIEAMAEALWREEAMATGASARARAEQIWDEQTDDLRARWRRFASSAYAALKALEAGEGQTTAWPTADWSHLPKDMYVTAVKRFDGLYEATVFQVPMAIGPEVRYVRADLIEAGEGASLRDRAGRSATGAAEASPPSASIPRAQWQPIATAPKDGSAILTCAAGYPVPTVLYWNPDWRDWVTDATEEEADGAGELVTTYNPTHWMPLPPTPASGIEARSAETQSGSVEDESPVGEAETPEARATRAEAEVERLREALKDLAIAEQRYRLTHDRLGDGHKETGRAWDLMRRAGDRARATEAKHEA